MQLSKEEAQVILQITERVNISGKEAQTIAYIQNKLTTFLQEQPKEEEKPAKK